MSTFDSYPYIYVNADGTARELHPNERQYLETEYRGGDGAAPYIKSSYLDRNGWNELKGYLKRSELPDGLTIYKAPTEDPCRPLNPTEYMEVLRARGMEVTKNSDGSIRISPPRRK